MSRKIKFRAYHPKFGMHYNPTITSEGWHCDFDIGHVNGAFSESNGGIIEQFTGLKDSKGKDIYEGDIVRQFHSYIEIESKNWVGQVRWSVSQQGFGYYPSFSLYINEYISFNLKVDCEVIGNIHENPELLK